MLVPRALFPGEVNNNISLYGMLYDAGQLAECSVWLLNYVACIKDNERCYIMQTVLEFVVSDQTLELVSTVELVQTTTCIYRPSA